MAWKDQAIFCSADHEMLTNWQDENDPFLSRFFHVCFAYTTHRLSLHRYTGRDFFFVRISFPTEFLDFVF